MPSTEPIPHLSAPAFANAERRGEALLHKLLHGLEKPADRLGLLIVAWNRCTEEDRRQFWELLPPG